MFRGSKINQVIPFKADRDSHPTWKPLPPLPKQEPVVVKRSGSTVMECRSVEEAPSSPEGSYAQVASKGIPMEDEGKVYMPCNKKKLVHAARQRWEETQKWKWLPGGVQINHAWIPITTRHDETSMMEEMFKDNQQYEYLREMPGWCYMALVKADYHYGFHWLVYPMAMQLAALPHQMRNMQEGAQIEYQMPRVYHVTLDMRLQYHTPWKTIESMAKGALKWVSLGTEVGLREWFMQQIQNLNTVVAAQTEQINIQTNQLTQLTATNMELQDRHQLREGGTPPY
ncbi:hypothetical protein SCLCIDRAFT_12021 [Scleroderma citrinum Foug A]|uniref:Uncharacterized protein n=1 Tax=Scleroderma citrinum Foug A TaxID=1036808 RepID=A0A0C3D618_9AGAM|nr:hypothetical protein SCLCIDRAFT_12021 [Scleroderma citrinum Foug A]